MLIMRAVVKALEKVEHEVTGMAGPGTDLEIVQKQKSHVIGMLNGILDMLNEYIKVQEEEAKENPKIYFGRDDLTTPVDTTPDDRLGMAKEEESNAGKSPPLKIIDSDGLEHCEDCGGTGLIPKGTGYKICHCSTGKAIRALKYL